MRSTKLYLVIAVLNIALLGAYLAVGAEERAELGKAGVAIGSTEVAKIACQVNEAVENIGARRLQTMMERLLEDLSFEAEDRTGDTVTIDAGYVRDRLSGLAQDSDLSKYIL